MSEPLHDHHGWDMSLQSKPIAKRYKVVQDANGNWGIYDGIDPWHEASFASYGPHSDLLDLIVDTAVDLNRGATKGVHLSWQWYYPRPGVAANADTL